MYTSGSQQLNPRPVPSLSSLSSALEIAKFTRVSTTDFKSGRGLWGSMVALNRSVQQAVVAASSHCQTDGIDSAMKRVELAHLMNIALQRHKTTFITLLHKPKSQSDREALQRSMTEAVSLQGFSNPAKLPESFVREALLISDMYNLNELAAFSLLKSAEEEKTLYPGLPRGLVAVLFYYDSREQFANAFKTLVQARQGISWTLLQGNEELSVSITRYLKSVLSLNMLDKLLEAIAGMDLGKEIDLLQQNRALGDARHRRMVFDKFKSVRSLFAETLFCWAAQTPLEKDECRRLIAYLSKVKLSETGDGSLDHVSLTLLMALLYSIESGHLLAAEDMTDALSSFPITADKTFVEDIHREITSGRDWECRGLKAVVQLAWAVSLTNLRQVANNVQLPDYDAFTDEDETLLAEALKGNVFTFMERSIFCASSLDQFYLRRFHGILADFIHRMPERVKHMKTKADENAQHIIAHLREGLQVPSNLEQPFEQFLTCLAALYESGHCEELIEEYWTDGLSGGSLNSRQVALKNFVQLPRDFLPHSLFIPYVKFLTSLANTESSAPLVYDFLRHSSRPGHQESNLSWDHFMSALYKYYQNLRIEQPAVESIYRSVRNAPRAITPQELEGLVVVLELVATVIRLDEAARVDLSSRLSFSPIELCAGLLTCCVPLSLKTGLLKVLAAFAVSPSIAVTVWQCIEAARIVPSVDGAPGYANRGIRQDIEEIESSAEEFPLSRALIALLIQLVNSGIPKQMSTSLRVSGFFPYLQLVKQQIFIPHDSRTYRRAEERWTLARSCCTLFHLLVTEYQPVSSQNTNTTIASYQPGHSMVLDFLHDSPLLKQLLNVLHDGVSILEQHIDTRAFEDLQQTLKLILEMFLKVLSFQRELLKSEENGPLMLVGLDKLLISVNPRTGNCDHMLNVNKLMGHHSLLPLHAALACIILSVVGRSVSGHKHLMPLLTTAATGVSTRQFLVQLIDHANLDDDHAEAASAALKLLHSLLQLPAPNLSHFFLGFLDGTGLRSGELRSDLLEPGIRGFPRTALHAILAVLPSLSPTLSELAHSLLHTLASHHTTADATLRYLSSRDFVFRSLSSLPMSGEETPDRTLASAWILRIAALDLRYHASHQQRSQLNRLITLLVSGSEPVPDSSSDAIDGSMTWMSGANGGEASSPRGVLLALLEMLELNVDPPQPLQCEYLVRAPDMVKACEEGTSAIVNIEMLYQLLHQFLQDNGPTGASISQKGPLEAEVQAVLDYALARNAATTLLNARKSFIESWGQLTEVAVTVTPPDMLETPLHKAFFHAITLELSRRLLDEIARPDLTSLLISTLLLLVTTLRNLYAQEIAANPNYSSIVANGGESPQVPSALLLILRGLVECVTRFRHSHQSVRANVYAALLNFLKIHCETTTCALLDSSVPSFLQATSESSVEQYQRESYDVVKEEIGPLLSVLCCEATAGHHLCRMLSLTCLSALVALEARASTVLGTGAFLSSSNSPLLEQLSQQGQLRRLLDGIEQDDNQLVNLVTMGGDLRPLYVWESRCALLAQLSLNASGARQLLQAGLMARLSKLQILSAGLEVGGAVILSAAKGALRVCQAIFSSLSCQDWSAGSQIAEFLSSQMHTLTSILQSYSASPEAAVSFETLALVAEVVASTAGAGQSNPSVLLLYQQLVSLMPHLLPPQSPENDQDTDEERDSNQILQLETLSSCLYCCCHHLVENPRAVTFQPTVDTRNNRALSLGTLVQALKFAAKVFKESSAAAKSTSSSLSSEERKQCQISRKKQHLSTYIAESAAFVIWRHLDTFLQLVPLTANEVTARTTSLALVLPSKMPLSAVQLGVLKQQLNEAFADVLPDLTRLHAEYAAQTSHVAFLPAIVARIRKMLTS